MAELIWSDDAISDLEGIYDYIARDSPLESDEIMVVAIVHGRRLLTKYFINRGE